MTFQPKMKVSERQTDGRMDRQYAQRGLQNERPHMRAHNSNSHLVSSDRPCLSYAQCVEDCCRLLE